VVVPTCMESRRHNGIAATENSANAMNCACQLQSTNIEMAPTSIAARPSHSMNTPGDNTSRTSSNPPAMNQSQNPSEGNNVNMRRAQLIGFVSERVGFAPAAGRLGRGGGLAAVPPEFGPNVALAISAMPPSEPSTLLTSMGSISTFWFGEWAISVRARRYL